MMKGWYIHINKMMHLANKKSIKLERVMFFAMETKILHVLGKLFVAALQATQIWKV